MPDTETRSTDIGSPDQAAQRLLEIVQGLARELHPAARPATLDNALDRDLGLDSLGRVELLLRIERAFGVNLPEALLADAETPRDLLRALLAGGGAHEAEPAAAVSAAAPSRLESAPELAATLVEALRWHVERHPERTHIVLAGEDAAQQEISYGALFEGAQSIAAGLQAHDLHAGETVAIMLPTGRDYFFSFFGVLLAGGVPVPIYPPFRPSQLEDHLRRHAGILSNAQATLLVTVPEGRKLARLLQAQAASLRSVLSIDALADAGRPAEPRLHGAGIALLQYTSGSTGNPKGVVLTHANLLANIRAMGQAAEVDSTDVFVSWLPLYHDMGLIGAWLGSLYHGCRFVAMSPLSFLARPQRWLWAIHRHRGTLSAAPNFAYELCARKVPDEAFAGLDLASWRMAFNGAEPVSADTVLRFQQRFAAHGLRPESVAPVYGLAECSVGLAFPPPGRGPLIDRVERDALTRSGRALPAAADDPHALRVVGCGHPLPEHQVRIVDATGREVGERIEGRLEFKGPSATSGYFRNPGETRRLFHGDWLDSGDLAYMAAGEIYLTGRAKDLIIRAGRNIYPHELEEAVGDIPGVRAGSVAVFGSPDAASGTERLVVMAETREKDPLVREQLRERINTVSVNLLGTPPDDVVLAPPHSVPKTSSGKIRRAASRELYASGGPAARPRGRWQQLARAAWSEAVPGLRRLTRAGRELAYAGYAWALFWLLAPPVWIIVALLPRPAWCRAAIHCGARLLIRLSGTPLTLRGLENLPQDAPCVLVMNHMSYLDGMILAACLPPPFDYAFIAKRELSEGFVQRIFLRHIGAEFVERFEAAQSAEDAKLAASLVHAGHTVVFFPEGTFQRMPGLLPFRMGAFVVAARTRVPLVPVTLTGSRSILRADQWFPRHGPLSVTIGQPIPPAAEEEDSFVAAVRLRDTARTEMLRHCGEPDLG
jgi:1-acyl-sn-glycerol-3-phosphate acyltransferase